MAPVWRIDRGHHQRRTTGRPWADVSPPQPARTAGTTLAVLAVVLLTGCSGTPEAQPTPLPGAVAVAQTSGARSATTTLAKPASGHITSATCTGTGHLQYLVSHRTGDITTSDGGGDIACPGVVNITSLTLPAGAMVTVEILDADRGVTGIVQLAPPRG